MAIRLFSVSLPADLDGLVRALRQSHWFFETNDSDGTVAELHPLFDELQLPHRNTSHGSNTVIFVVIDNITISYCCPNIERTIKPPTNKPIVLSISIPKYPKYNK